MVAFFLHRLVKLLQDGHDDVIEWSTEGDLHVYSSKRLEADILPNYYGHAKFTSFLRQLTSYGFSRILNNTKSRLPLDCCYKNEETTKDVNSLLKLKKKTAPNPSAKRMLSLQKKKSKKSVSAPVFIESSTEIPMNSPAQLQRKKHITNTPILPLSSNISDDKKDDHIDMTVDQLPTLAVPRLYSKNNMYGSPDIIQRPLNIISRSSSVLESPSQSTQTNISKQIAHATKRSNTNHVENNTNSVYSQALLEMNQISSMDELQYDNDFNNVLSSLMVADFSEQGSFYSEYEDVLKVLVSD